MLHGALPFVDIWDRKPLGLFLLFAAIRELGGEGIVQYQLVALLSVVATSVVIWRTARMIAPPVGALCAGVAYQLFLSVFFCFGGQSPVYYNLPVALVGLWMAHLMVARPSPRALFLHGLGVMLVIGAALQIKYTVVFEGIGFGLALMDAHALWGGAGTRCCWPPPAGARRRWCPRRRRWAGMCGWAMAMPSCRPISSRSSTGTNLSGNRSGA
jgi:hypothetical protein